MNDLLRSITILAMAFVGVVVVTLGFAAVLVPGQTASVQRTDPSAAPAASRPVAPTPAPPAPGALGGGLAVSGDREGVFVLLRESTDGNYALVGDDGRLIFGGGVGEITQISYDGLEFFPEPGECTVTPGERHPDTGVGEAMIACQDIADVRNHGVISLAGELGLPLDMIAPRELPQTGGTVSAGTETWTFPYAFLTTWHSAVSGVGGNGMDLVDEEAGVTIHFDYDVQTHETSLVEVARAGEAAEVPSGACALARRVLGRPNPRTTTVEMTIDCPPVEVPGLGPVPLQGVVTVDEIELSF